MTCAGAMTATSPTRAIASRRRATISHTLDRAVVVGHSRAAMIALTFAVKRHDRVSRVVVFANHYTALLGEIPEVKSALRGRLSWAGEPRA
jgi:pimeloyl-ACP methyl ester carboxylesterase